MSEQTIQTIAPKLADGLGLRVRSQRHRLSMTLSQLSAAAGVLVGYLRQGDRGNAPSSRGTLNQISQARQVDAGFFVRTQRAVDSLTRRDARPKFVADGSPIAYEQIGAERAGHALTSLGITVPSGYVSQVVHHIGEEIIDILEGEISQMVGKPDYMMDVGNSLHHLGTTPQCWSNKTERPARIFWVGRMQHDKSSDVEQIKRARVNDRHEMLPLGH